MKQCCACSDKRTYQFIVINDTGTIYEVVLIGKSRQENLRTSFVLNPGQSTSFIPFPKRNTLLVEGSNQVVGCALNVRKERPFDVYLVSQLIEHRCNPLTPPYRQRIQDLIAPFYLANYYTEQFENVAIHSHIPIRVINDLNMLCRFVLIGESRNIPGKQKKYANVDPGKSISLTLFPRRNRIGIFLPDNDSDIPDIFCPIAKRSGTYLFSDLSEGRCLSLFE